jgi:hypothetical protein
MKRIILSIVFTIGLVYPAAFAGDDSINAHIARTLYMMFKMPNMNCFVNANEYKQKTFVYNGMQVTAFKSKTSNWAGFFKKLSAQDLPENALSAIKSKYKSGTIENVMMYFDVNADVSYFTEISMNNKYIILKIQPSGEIEIFNCKPASNNNL